MIDIQMPRLSDTMEEGAIAAWRKKPGDTVTAGEILVEIETDKAIMEHEAYDSGVLHEILVHEGEQAAIGTTIARIDDGASSAGPVVRVPAEEATDAEGETPPSAPALPRPAASGRRVASPLVRRLAREHEIDLDRVTGTGPGGRIVRADIEDALAEQQSAHDGAAVPAPQPSAIATVPDPTDLRSSSTTPFDTTREVISRRLTHSSSTTPHFSVTTAADVEDLLALRARLNDQFEGSSRPKISVNDLIVRASAIALRRHPGINASYSAEGRGGTQLHGRVNIGIAVASDSGLVVPVIRDVEQKTVSQIAAESKELARHAHSHTLTPSHMTGGTFTISNLGMYGVEQFTAIINPPEGAILAVGSAQPEPAVHEGAIAIRHRMRVTLSADHRIIDGALAAQFLQSLRQLLENPLNILA